MTPADERVVLAVDLPLVKAELLERLAGRARDEAVSVVPWRDAHFEPLAAAWHRSAIPALTQAQIGNLSLQAVTAELQQQGLLRAFQLSPSEATQLTNVNSPDDLVRLG